MKTAKASSESGLETSPVGLSFFQAFFGMNPANQLWYGSTPFLSRRPNSAVPVLPATTIGRSARLYVCRLVTTRRAASRIVVKTQLVALADPGLEDLAREDGLAERVQLPLVRRDEAGGLAGEVDPGLLAETIL